MCNNKINSKKLRCRCFVYSKIWQKSVVGFKFGILKNEKNVKEKMYASNV